MSVQIKHKEMKKKKYEIPSLTTTTIDTTCQLLAGSNGKTGPSGPGTSTGSGSSAAPEMSGPWIDDEEE